MRFEILSHACLHVENADVNLLVDPWLIGSSYWRSWWNYPKAHLIQNFNDINYVYLTHIHWDHFHGPTLRKLPKSATILIPKGPTKTLLENIQYFGFNRVIEMPHGRELKIGTSLSATSYQFGLSLDSMLTLSDGKTVLVDMNDCKITGSTLRHFIRRHPKVDFLFRSHSSASAYPHCVTAEDPTELELRRDEDYMVEFVNATKLLNPTFSVPFASNHCYLHKETFRFNGTIVSPLEVKRFYDQTYQGPSKCVVMLPGDSWNDSTRFRLNNQDLMAERETRLAAYAHEVEPILARYYETEDKTEVTFESFRLYFERLLSSIPKIHRLVFKPVVVFQRSSIPGSYWIIDFRKHQVVESNTLPKNVSFTLTIHPAILKDCLTRHMFLVLMPSKRLRVSLSKGALRDFILFGQILDLFEYGFFPLRKTLNLRFLVTWIRRYREVFFYLGMAAKMIRTKAGKQKMSVVVPKIS